MEAVAGPFAIVAVVVAVGGVSKLMSPESTTSALRGVGLPANDTVSRGLGLAELLIGAIALAYGSRGAAAVLALTYVGFAGFVELARRGGQTSCGCFGRDDTPPTLLHTGVNVVAAAVALFALFSGVAPIDETLASQPWSGVPFVGFVLLGSTLTTAVLVFLPTVLTAPRRVVPSFDLAGGQR